MSARGDDVAFARRKRLFRIHVVAYAAGVLLAIGLNVLVFRPDFPWSAFLAMGWLAPLALHTAIAVGLFDGR